MRSNQFHNQDISNNRSLLDYLMGRYPTPISDVKIREPEKTENIEEGKPSSTEQFDVQHEWD